ncbi:2-amino-4-hydroxy-6-hydroxymethyldihydropteridine diphosphokinase [Aureococcus anophagefferens]|uniref:2-amino-4-hydroxy-6-hydroxymethyldihydropteridine diphosphokinase n=1 Tax=Aureococcus anophagefferens TaxID=44056 RepID=A0ABR1FW12_AURAN
MGCFSMCRLALLLLAVALDASALDASARLGFYGLGTMGTHMAGHLHGLAASSGGRAAVASRGRQGAEAWAAALGAGVRGSFAELAEAATSSACARLPEHVRLSRDFGFGFKMGLMREDCAIADALVADLAPTHALIPEATRLIRGGGAAGERRGLRAAVARLLEARCGEELRSRMGASGCWRPLGSRLMHCVVSTVSPAAPRAPPEAAVEAALGREDRGRHGPREVDLGVLFHGATMVAGADLEVPHPRAARRDFVLRPLRDARRALDAFGVPYDARDVAPSTTCSQRLARRVVDGVAAELRDRVAAAAAAGVAPWRVLVDPGVGFAKDTAQNVELLQGWRGATEDGDLPLLLGVSRKRTWAT